MFDMKKEIKQLEALALLVGIVNEILEIVFNEHPEIVTKAITNVGEKK